MILEGLQGGGGEYFYFMEQTTIQKIHENMGDCYTAFGNYFLYFAKID